MVFAFIVSVFHGAVLRLRAWNKPALKTVSVVYFSLEISPNCRGSYSENLAKKTPVGFYPGIRATRSFYEVSGVI